MIFIESNLSLTPVVPRIYCFVPQVDGWVEVGGERWVLQNIGFHVSAPNSELASWEPTKTTSLVPPYSRNPLCLA